MPFFPSQYGNLFGKGTVQRPLIYGEGDEEIETQSTDSPGDQPSSTTQGSDTGSQDGGGGRRRDGAVVITSGGVFPAPSLNGAHMSRNFGAAHLNPRNFGNAEEINKGLAGVGAAGFGMMGALVGAVAGSSLPFKDGWLYGAIAGFMLPVIILAPKTEESA